MLGFGAPITSPSNTALESVTITYNFSDENIDTIVENSQNPSVTDQFIRIQIYGTDKLAVVKYEPITLEKDGVKGISRGANTLNVLGVIRSG